LFLFQEHPVADPIKVLESLKNRESRAAALRRLRVDGLAEGIPAARIAAAEHSLETAFALADVMNAIRRAICEP
jgi:hypothetical protein